MRKPPYSEPLERSLLATLLVGESTDEIMTYVREEYFFATFHRRVFAAAAAQYAQRGKIDPVLVREHLDEEDEDRYLALQRSEIIYSDIRSACERLADFTLLRDHIETSSRFMSKAYEAGPILDARGIAATFENEVVATSQRYRGDDDLTFQQLVTQDLYAQPKQGLVFPIKRLANIVPVVEPGELIIVGARPSMGKSTFLRNLVWGMRSSESPDSLVPSLIFTLEVPKRQLAEQFLCLVGRIPRKAYRERMLDEAELTRLAHVKQQLAKAPIHVEDKPGATLADIRAHAFAYKYEHDIQFLLIDYLQLMGMPTAPGTGDNRDQKLGYITRGLKALSKELGIVTFLFAQLSRKCEERRDKRPVMSDLRESGNLEQDCDIGMLLYRAERYGIMTDDEGYTTEGIIEIIVGKQRDGDTGTAKAAFVSTYPSIENLSYMQNLGIGRKPESESVF